MSIKISNPYYHHYASSSAVTDSIERDRPYRPPLKRRAIRRSNSPKYSSSSGSWRTDLFRRLNGSENSTGTQRGADDGQAARYDAQPSARTQGGRHTSAQPTPHVIQSPFLRRLSDLEQAANSDEAIDMEFAYDEDIRLSARQLCRLVDRWVVASTCICDEDHYMESIKKAFGPLIVHGKSYKTAHERYRRAMKEQERVGDKIRRASGVNLLPKSFDYDDDDPARIKAYVLLCFQQYRGRKEIE